MKYFYAIIFFLVTFWGCKKDSPEKAATIKPNTLTLQSGGKTFTLDITDQLILYSGAADLLLVASAQEVEIKLHARSYTHSLGAGNYFFTCCENEVLEKFIAGQYYDGVDNGEINGTASEKGNLTITNINQQGFSGTFSFIGQNAVGDQKSFTGSFKVVY